MLEHTSNQVIARETLEDPHFAHFTSTILPAGDSRAPHPPRPDRGRPAAHHEAAPSQERAVPARQEEQVLRQDT